MCVCVLDVFTITHVYIHPSLLHWTKLDTLGLVELAELNKSRGEQEFTQQRVSYGRSL